MTVSWSPLKAAFVGLMATSVQLSFATPIDPSATVADGARKFGFAAFQSLHQSKLSEPVAISPFSLMEALSMASMGAEDETKAEMESLFLTPAAKIQGADSQTLIEGVKKLREDLVDFAKQSDGAFEFTSANALWGNNNPKWGFSFTKTFLKDAKDNYDAGLTTEDFADASTVTHINEWVAKGTKDKITHLISQLGEDDVAVLLNATYAKGKFAQNFGNITSGDYTKADGSKVPASFMSRSGYIPFYENADVRMFSLEIGDFQKPTGNEAIALDVIESPKGDLDALVSYLTGDNYGKAVAKLQPTDLELTISAGRVSQSSPLKMIPVLAGQPFNLSLPFDKKFAQFAPLGTTSTKKSILHIGDVVTKTFYEVTPFGFEAAAATAVTFAAATSVQLPPPSHKIEGPSIHVVRSVRTGLPLFISVYDSPVEYTEKEIIELVSIGLQTDRNLSAETPNGTIVGRVDFNTGEKSVLLVDAQGAVIKVLKTL
jgi:serpin B